MTGEQEPRGLTEARKALIANARNRRYDLDEMVAAFEFKVAAEARARPDWHGEYEVEHELRVVAEQARGRRTAMDITELGRIEQTIRCEFRYVSGTRCNRMPRDTHHLVDNAHFEHEYVSPVPEPAGEAEETTEADEPIRFSLPRHVVGRYVVVKKDELERLRALEARIAELEAQWDRVLEAARTATQNLADCTHDCNDRGRAGSRLDEITAIARCALTPPGSTAQGDEDA